MITARLLSEEAQAIALHEQHVLYEAQEEIRLMEEANRAMESGDIETYNKLMRRLPQIADFKVFNGVY